MAFVLNFVQFLLMDKLFPRSVFHALRQAETCLIELDNRPTVRIGAKAEALRLLGRARSELEFLRPDELLDDLPSQLKGLRKKGMSKERAAKIANTKDASKKGGKNSGGGGGSGGGSKEGQRKGGRKGGKKS